MRVLIDSGALMHVLGTKMDFVTNRIKCAPGLAGCCLAVNAVLSHSRCADLSSPSRTPTPRASVGVGSLSPREACHGGHQ